MIPAADSELPGWPTADTWSTTDSAPSSATCDPAPVVPRSTVAPGSALGELVDSCSWEISPTTAPVPSVGSERPPWLAGWSTHPADGVGDPISGSGSTWTIPFSISSGPRWSSGFGVSPTLECGLPPPTESSGPERPLGSPLGRSALSRSESVPACLLPPASVENHPISVPARCGGRGSSPADPSAVVGAAVRGDDSPDPPLDVPESAGSAPGRSSTVAASPARTAPEAWPGGSAVPGSPWPRSAADPCAGGPDIPWPP
jgi:hypothetical protein